MADKKLPSPADALSALDTAHARDSAALQAKIDEATAAVAAAKAALDTALVKARTLQAEQVNASFAFDAARARTAKAA